VGGNAEALADGACGQLVPPEDVLAMRAAVLALLHSSEHRARLGAAAAQRAHAEYDLSTMLDRTERLYEEVLAQA
jgi:Glycosyltransferase